MIRLALCQINVTVGDIKNNSKNIISYIHKARKLQADIACFPELVICGYPPEDLLLNPAFIMDNMESLKNIVSETKDIIAIVGYADKRDDLYNAAAVICNGKIVNTYHKIHLPNYGVFDEVRYFQAGNRAGVYNSGRITFAVNICEDIWHPGDPTRLQALQGNAQLIINISSSPYHTLKPRTREEMLSVRASDYSVYLAFCNLVGGQDELIFDGSSSVIGPDGDTIARASCFEEEMLVVDLDPVDAFSRRLHDPRRRREKILQQSDKTAKTLSLQEIKINPQSMTERTKKNKKLQKIPFLTEDEEIFKALVTGTRDYCRKNGFKKVVIGLSGGIDSSLVACLAVEALGNDNVVGVSMPSMFSSQHSIEDAEKLAAKLRIKVLKLPITDAFQTYRQVLSEPFKSKQFDVAEENLQSRIRGNLLMALSNKFGYLVLTTGNKSEMSMGYATLYGDMAGGFAVIKDIYKTTVYKLAHYYNRKGKTEVIPKRVFTKAPSAELRPNQKDTDSLPLYEVLDPILKCYIEKDMSSKQISQQTGADEKLVRKILDIVNKNEYKRRQAPPGIKITERAFGKDRRFPITCSYVSK